MNPLKKTRLVLWVSVFFLWNSPSAGATGFIFNWTPFAIDKTLELHTDDSPFSNQPSKFLPNNIVFFEEANRPFLHEINHEKSADIAGKKSIWDNVKIVFSPASEDQDKRNHFHDVYADKQVSRFLDSLQAFIYSDKKIQSLEEIGKVIQPQINFYLEF